MSKQEGMKFDSIKPRAYLLPPKALLEVSKVLTVGAEKYDEENWRKLDNLQNRYTGAALRHLFAHMDGEELDPETNLSHIAHAVCCLLFKLEVELEKTKKESGGGSVRFHHRQSDQTTKPQYFGETYNQEGSVRSFKDIVQYSTSSDDNRGVQ